MERRGTSVGWITASSGCVADQDIIGREPAGAPLDAEPGRGVALRVEIDDQDVFADRRERGAEIDSRGRFSHAAFLIRDGEHAQAAERAGAAARLRRQGRRRFSRALSETGPTCGENTF